MSKKPPRVLVVDVGGSHVKFLASGERHPRKFASGKTLSAAAMVSGVIARTQDWRYDVVSIGIPGPVVRGRPASKPPNLGKGWVGFDFAAAFKRPVKIVNDAALQGLVSYAGGRMLFLGLGTGLGSVLIVEGVIADMELAHLPYKHGKTYEDYVGQRGLDRLGKKKWRRAVHHVIGLFQSAFAPDYTVLGGGNIRHLKHLPKNVRLGDNANAFAGGFRLWTLTPATPSRSART